MKSKLSKTIIVVEGESDAKLLKKLLADDLKHDAGIVVGNGIVSALSTAHQLRNDQQYLGTRVVLVMDDDSDHRNLAYAELLLGKGKDDFYFRLVAFQPEIEILFFEDRGALEAALGRSMPDIVWELGRVSPKKAIELLLKERGTSLEQLLAIPSYFEFLKRNEKLQSIGRFIRAAEEAVH